ncbi:MAG: hypothetical protein KDC98_23090 [Planctomycetes bacterium]|nr:hypothetical protein [Planctomycetota bacterium]
MDAATGLQPIVSRPIVDNRPDQRRGNREAFRRALQQQDGDAPAGEGEGDGANEAAERPLRSGLQNHGPTGRRKTGAGHIDLLA